MKANPGPGKLIVLEGLDGAGTTTQAERLARWLRQHHPEAVPHVHVTREPTLGPAGAQIRSVLTRRLRVDGMTLAALFATDRLDHLYEPTHGVIARLRAGTWVLMDRYYLSSFAYQALSMDEAALAWLAHLHAPCLVPDATFFLDVPVDVCVDRIANNRGFRFELFERKDSLEAVYAKYREAIARFRAQGETIQIIDGVKSPPAVAKALQQRVRVMFLEENRMPEEEVRHLWRTWPGLAQVRREAERELALHLLAVKRIPYGYQLEFADAEDIYHLFAYTSGTLTLAGKRTEVYERLNALLPADCSIYGQNPLPGLEDL